MIKRASKKALICRRDYDLYSVRLPYSMIRKRHRSIFVRRELEKRHPRFSERCCIDTKISFRSGKPIAEIAVMDKWCLAQYKKEFPGKRLYLEEQPKRSVFKNASVGKRVQILLVCIAAILCVIKMYERKRMDSVIDATALEQIPQPVQSAFLSPEQLLATVLAAISKKGGTVTSIDWQGNTCNFLLNGCYPEDIVSGQTSVVSYDNARPYFALSLPAQPNEVLDEQSATGDDFVPALRHSLLACGVMILSEQIGKDDATIHFFADFDSLPAALQVCAEQAALQRWSERACVLQRGETGCDVKVSFTAGVVHYESQSPLQVLATYSSLFERNQSDVPVRPRYSGIEKKSVVARDKVGEIRRLDGVKFIYYRLSDGQIVCELEKIGG